MSICEGVRTELLANKANMWFKPLTLFPTGMLIAKAATDHLLQCRLDKSKVVAVEQLKDDIKKLGEIPTATIDCFDGFDTAPVDLQPLGQIFTQFYNIKAKILLQVSRTGCLRPGRHSAGFEPGAGIHQRFADVPLHWTHLWLVQRSFSPLQHNSCSWSCSSSPRGPTTCWGRGWCGG